MPKAKPKNILAKWEVAIIKMMIETGKYKDQEILAYFTRPNRTVNHARISEIRNKHTHKTTKASTEEELERFLKNWPEIDWKTGLHLRNNEQLIKSREAILLAVQTYNNPTSHFRSESFIVNAIIAWTYLLHAYFRENGTDIRYKKKSKSGTWKVQKTKHGTDKLWDLSHCLGEKACPLTDGMKNNLEFLLIIRHEIEHQMTQKIDDQLAPKLLACCINFNSSITSLFGKRYSLDEHFVLALQFRAFDPNQIFQNEEGSAIPESVAKAIANYEGNLTDEEYSDQTYSCRYLFVPKMAASKSAADKVVEIIKAGSDDAVEMNQIFFKETEKGKFKPGYIVKQMQAHGFPKFNMHHHTMFWKNLDAGDPNKGYGIELSDGQWYWYQRWLDRVLEHCKENSALYK